MLEFTRILLRTVLIHLFIALNVLSYSMSSVLGVLSARCFHVVGRSSQQKLLCDSLDTRNAKANRNHIFCLVGSFSFVYKEFADY